MADQELIFAATRGAWVWIRCYAVFHSIPDLAAAEEVRIVDEGWIARDIELKDWWRIDRLLLCGAVSTYASRSIQDKRSTFLSALDDDSRFFRLLSKPKLIGTPVITPH